LAFRRFLVVVRLGDTSPRHLSAVVPPLQTQLASVSAVAPEQVWRSVNADVFGYFIKSSMNAGQISAALDKPVKMPAFLGGHDSVLVIEVGTDFSASQEFTMPITWLRRN
jgi:hypothetical protein